MKEFNWKEAEYPCFGITKDKDVVCFSSYKKGHVVESKDHYESGQYSSMWNMEIFKPYIQQKEKTKLWYWEYKYGKYWNISTHRLSEDKAKEESKNGRTYRKLEVLGYIEED